MREHLLTFEQQWTDEASGRTLPKFVTAELHQYLDCAGFSGGASRICMETIPHWRGVWIAESAIERGAE